MACFIMKALTPDGDWVEFTLNDMPLLFSDNLFVLTKRNNSPHLLYNTIRRGDPETNLYEGDVIEMDGTEWLVCYERGFYIINKDYNIRHFTNLNEFYVQGTCTEHSIDIPATFKNKHLFRYGESLFTLKDIVGSYNDKLILRFAKEPVSVEDVDQECCCTYKKTKLFFNDVIEDSRVVLYKGRVALHKNNTYVDVVTGGIIDGCNT